MLLMIKDLNAKVEGKRPVNDFTPVPEGQYNVKVVEIKPWKALTKNIMLNTRDNTGRLVKDEKGNLVKELVKDFTFYNADVRLEILDGEHKGRLLFTSLTTHPNAEFITKNFLYAVGVSEITLNQIQAKCTGLKLIVDVVINENNYKIEKNPVTGAETKVPNPRNEVKAFLKPELVAEEIPGL
jgi:hypothetical protein